MSADQAIIGVDVGGTFTDLVLMEPATGVVRVAKVPTTADNQAAGVLDACDEVGARLDRVGHISHGTTTTTNALLERKISRCGLITTKGFRDVLELGRRTRPRSYGLIGAFTPLIPRDLRLEVAERMDADGEVLIPLDEDGVRQAIAQLRAADCESLLIHFLHSYRNPAHEQRAAEIAAALWPNRYVTAGHRILSEYREYERGVTAAVNAAVQPVLHRYIDRLDETLAARGYAHDLLVMQGNGGSVSSRLVAERAVHTVMSGPASGVMAAAAAARAVGIERLITYDMGGTSTDVGLVDDGMPRVTGEMELEYAMPVHVPMVDLHAIGAGGGSIAHLDKAGLLKVGPESAGASPGPICSGQGGIRPTVTDANLVLGRLDPAGLLAVENPVPVDRVRAVMEESIGRPLGLDGDDAAAAIIRVGNDSMASAIRMVSLARGHDPRDFTLFAFGGAGPMHAAALARELAIPEVLIPARPGITNAVGCITADLRHDYVATVNTPLGLLDVATLRSTLEAQIAEGDAIIAREGIAVTAIEQHHFADMQFEGQTHLLTVPIAGPEVTVAELRAAFEAAYWDRFQVTLDDIRPILITLRTAVIGRRETVSLAALAGTGDGGGAEPAETGRRPVWFDGGWLKTPILDRARLRPGAVIEGPAIVTQLDCTTVIEPANRATVDALANLRIEIQP